MRLRTLTLLLGCAAAGGAGMWLYASGTQGVGVGASGLPLIKADMAPVKIPPDNADNDVIPNADSTVFSAMGETAATADPSMENIAPPQPDTTAQSAEPAKPANFAGFRTGFSLPKPAPVKTESLFASDPALPAGSKYVTGMENPVQPEEPAPIQAAASEAPPEPAKEPAGEKPAAAQPPQNIVPAVEQPEAAQAEPTPEAAPVVTGQTAQDMEAQEKTLARPSVKPPVPVATKPAKPETKAPETKAPETKTPETKTAEKPVPAKKNVPKPAENTAPVPASIQPASGGGSYYIQLSSVPKGGDSARKWAQLQSMYPDALRGLGPSYQPVTIPGKGEYIRVQAGPVATQADANKRCTALRAEDPKGGCLVIRR